MEKQVYGNSLNGSRLQAMPIERRQSPREECNVKAVIVFKNREVGADLRNISAGGAFLLIAEEDNDKITSSDEGQNVTFRLTNGKSRVNYKGVIGRYTETVNNTKYVAVYFKQRSSLVSI